MDTKKKNSMEKFGKQKSFEYGDKQEAVNNIIST